MHLQLNFFFFSFIFFSPAQPSRGGVEGGVRQTRGGQTYRENDHFDGMEEEESQKKTRRRKGQRSGTGLENRKERKKKGRDPPERGNLKII